MKIQETTFDMHKLTSKDEHRMERLSSKMSSLEQSLNCSLARSAKVLLEFCMSFLATITSLLLVEQLGSFTRTGSLHTRRL